ncbi:MAG: hypothetical protein H6737_19205 [Alphaproteobacteria bacterium]|nr:hypothetical protein [Alphaproteobacteria bacterium]
MTRSIVLVGLLLPGLAFAGKKDKAPKVDPDHANHFKNVEPAGDDVKFGVEDAWARDAEAKMKVLVQNDSADYVLVKTEEFRFEVGGNEYAPKTGMLQGKNLVVDPKSHGNRVLNAEGTGMHQESLTVKIAGAFLVPKNAPVQAAPDFRLPLEMNDFKAGNFSCAVPKKIKQETDETAVRFECRYEGSAIGIVDPKQIQVRLEDGQAFANDDKKMDPQVVLPGEEFKFDAIFHVSAKVVDMQFANMHVVFNETFREGEPRALEVPPIALALDPALTAAKND